MFSFDFFKAIYYYQVWAFKNSVAQEGQPPVLFIYDTRKARDGNVLHTFPSLSL